MFARFKTRIRTYFITGFLAILPIFATILIISGIIRFVKGAFQFSFHLDTALLYKILYSLIGVGVTLCIILFVGWVLTLYVGRRLFSFGEGLLVKVPLVSTIYNALKQLMESFVARRAEGYKQTVLVEYPRRGLYVLGFVTNTEGWDILSGEERGERFVSVFVPTSPNPTSGMLIVVKKEEAIPLDLNTEEAIKLIISGGIISPSKELRKTLVKTDDR
jgi:uncharacterized membrane protein